MKAVLDALGVSYVVEQGQDEGGTWYRRFSNGWVEQGAVISGKQELDVTLPIEMANDQYIVSVNRNYTVNTGANVPCSWNFTTTGFRINTSTANRASWEAKGFAA